MKTEMLIPGTIRLTAGQFLIYFLCRPCPEYADQKCKKKIIFSLNYLSLLFNQYIFKKIFETKHLVFVVFFYFFS